MELYQLSDGVTTIYLRSKTNKQLNGFNYSNYLPEITQSFDPSFEGMPFVEAITGTFTAEYKEIATLTGTEFDVTYLIWDEEPDTSPFTVFTGIAQFAGYTVKDDKNFREEVFVNYKLVANRTILEDDLLSAAYDLKQVDTDTATYNDGRLTPMNFGYIKYAPAFMLAITCATGCGGVYSADGKTTNMTQEGIDTNFTQGAGATYAVVTDPKPPYQVYQDADATGTTASSITVEPIVTPVQAALTTTNVTITDTVGGTEYIAYATDANGLESFSVDTSGNVKTGGIIQSINGTASTATRLTIHGAYISSQTGVGTSTRLSYVLTNDGQSHWYIYNTTTNQWNDVANIGQSTDGTDFFSIYALNDGDVAIKGKATTGGSGVWGVSDTGVGVFAQATGTGVPIYTSPRASAPTTGLGGGSSGTALEGSIYYNSTDKHFYGHNGTSWLQLDN